MRDIGTAGESFIEQWCALSGITANRSHKDFFGWDLHFEMPHLNNIAKADGLHQADIECKVQVKTTDTDKMTEAVELSNLRAMATCTLPAFYILVKLEGGSQVVSAHLLHIDDALCEKILARIRKETSKNGKVKLNKKFMTLDFKTGVQIIPPGGEGLKKEIMEHIGASQADYVIKKQKFLQSVGYELHSHEISVQIAMENADRFVRMLLGDKDTIEVKSIDASVTRFGVTETLEGLRSDTAIISLGNIVPDGRAKVIFRNRKSGAASEFDLDVYRGGSAACIPPKHRIVRLRSTLFTMDISPFHNNLKMYFHGDNDATYDVVEVLKNYTLLQMLSNPREIDISIKINESHLNGKLSGDGFGKDFDRSVELLEAVIFIKNFYSYYNYLGVSAGWFDRYSTSILNYKDIISGHANLERIEFVFTVDDSLDDDSEVDCLVALPIVIDQKCFVSLIVFHGRSKMIEDGSYVTRPKNIKVIYKTFFNIESLTSGSAMRDLEEAVNAYDSSCIRISFLNKYMDAVVTNAKNATPIER